MDTLGSSEASANNYQIVVNGIGTASASLFSALKHAISLPEAEIARRILQAPSTLISKVNKDTAEKIRELLNNSGLDSQILLETEQLQEGTGDHEIALVISSFKDIHKILPQLIQITGLSTETAITLLNKNPTVFLGNISEVTAKTIQKRFLELGIETDISKPKSALYDMAINAENHTVQQHVESLLNEKGLPFKVSQQQTSKLYSINEIPYEEANDAWQKSIERKIPCELMNQDYQRYDIELDQINDQNKEDIKSYLIQSLGIPEKVVNRVISSVPVVVAKHKTLSDTRNILSSLTELNCLAKAELVSSLTFNIQIESLPENGQAQHIFSQLLGLREATINQIIQGRTQLIEGPFSYNQARWAQYEFQKIGGKVRLIKRQ